MGWGRWLVVIAVAALLAATVTIFWRGRLIFSIGQTRITGWILGILGLAVIVCVATFIWRGPSSFSIGQTRTTGAIFVSGPQVYTRERLVNDRYREDAWLATVLGNTTELVFGVAATSVRNSSYNGSFSVAAQPSGAAPTEGDSKSAEKSNAAAVPISLSPFDDLQARLAYRERVGTQTIENQLDDRHDLHGNSLYRLRFDVAILPGNNTSASAKITVKIRPRPGLLDWIYYSGGAATPTATVPDKSGKGTAPEKTRKSMPELTDLKPDERKAWQSIYRRWLDSLDKRFEDGRTTMQAAYDTESFSPNDYETLLKDMRERAKDILFTNKYMEKLAQKSADEKDRDNSGATNVGVAGNGALPMLKKNELDMIESTVQVSAELRERPDTFRSKYKLGATSQHGPGHKLYKDEIKRLLGLVSNARRQSQGFISQQAKITPFLQQTVRPPRPIETNDAAPTFSPCDGQSALYPAVLTKPEEGEFGLSYFLDHAFEAKLAKSILGLQLEHSPLGDPLNRTPPLDRLASEASSYGSVGLAYRFSERTLRIGFTTVRGCIPKEYGETHSMEIDNINQVVFLLKSQTDYLKLRVPDFDLNNALRQYFKEHPPIAGNGARRVDAIDVSVGLLNFVRAAIEQVDAFSYAFAPSEPDQITASHLIDARFRSVAAQAPANIAGSQMSIGGGVKQDDRADINTNEHRQMVVPFGDQRDKQPSCWKRIASTSACPPATNALPST
jgi:hypothetical protein